MVGKNTILRFFYGIIFAAFVITGMGASKPVPPDVYMGPPEKVKEMPAFKKLIVSNPENLERNKIDYLLVRVQQSRYEFVRNETEYKSSRAASHLRMKYSKRVKQIKTARDFIENIAAGSILTGEVYKIRIDDKTEYPLKDVLYNELRLVEETLSNQKSA